MSEQHRKLSGRSVAGRYVLGNYLGGTDHSAVFATEIVHARSQRVAIKLIPATGIIIARQLMRWKALAALSHPNLLKIVDYGRCDLDGAYLFVVMEFADEDLADILPQRALNAEETRGMLEPVIETLAFLHEQGLVHTRVHPGNILATGDQIKLSSESISPKGEPVGFGTATEGFAPPEWGTGNAELPEDVWSLGATVIAALTQSAPAAGEDGELALPENLPEPFGVIARESLKKDPAQRITLTGIRGKLNPASVPPVKEAAPEVKETKTVKKEPPRIDPVSVPVSKVPPPTRVERPPETGGKRSYFLPIAAAAVVLILILAVPKLFKHSDAAPAEKASSASSSPAGNASASKPVSSAKATPKKSAPEQVLTETAQPAAPAPAPPAKAASKPSDPAKGEILDQVLPDVSDKARATIRGTVRVSLRVHVNAGGTVDSAEPEPPAASQYFTELAIKAAKRWQFSGPEVNGRIVESEWLLHFEFTPTATNVRPAQVSP
ncbi:MAG TPA: TonB family protein [Candidatus Acidoferrum sp.]|nr:TonB family protein [Candidatus Acidoferrum sp.]